MKIILNTDKKNRRKIGKLLVLTLPIILSCLYGAFVRNQPNVVASQGGKVTSSLPQPVTASWLKPAPPISILSDSDWVSEPSRFWVNGSGTWASPYVLANLSIDRSGVSGVVCIDIENTGKVFRIVNCTLYYGTSSSGIELVTAGNGTLFNNTCTGEGNGIALFSSANNNTVVGNNCTGTSSSARGIYLQSASNNTLAANTAQGIAGTEGIMLMSSDNNTITGNNCTGIADGIRFQSSNKNNCTGNILTGNANGFSFNSANNNTLSYNNCTGGGTGISLAWSENNTLACNNCSWSSFNYGIDIESSSHHTLVVGNNCTGNFLSGINVFQSNFTTLEGNNCSGNTAEGICINQDANSTLMNNICMSNTLDGIYLTASKSFNNTLSGNNCSLNVEHGIYVSAAGTNNTLTGNNCTGNGQLGIDLISSSWTTLDRNICATNLGSDGIDVAYGSNNTVTRNNCTGATLYGIQISDSSGALVTGNTCSKDLTGIDLTSGTSFCEVAYNWIRKFTGVSIENDASTNNVHDNFVSYAVFTAGFTANYTTINLGSYIGFTDNTAGGAVPLSYQWNFGDGTGNSTLQNPSHRFIIGGPHLVILTVTDAEEDISISQQTINVNALPLVANFTASVHVITAGGSVTFTDTTTGGVSPYTNYMWSWGDGTANGTTTPVTHQYAAYGVYTVTLTVTDNVGNMSGYQMTITVNALPLVAAFSPSAHVISAGGSVTFTDTTTGGVSPYTTYMWSWGDATANGTTTPVTHQYAAYGVYTVTLTVTDKVGNMSSYQMTITVNALPLVAAFSPSAHVISAGGS